jgi:hypothetical protein
LAAPGEVRWFIHTRARPELAEDGRAVVLTQNGRAMLLRVSKPDEARFEIAAAAPLPTSPHPPKQAENPGVSRIEIHLSGVDRLSIETQFSMR